MRVYTCAACGETYETDRTDDQAEAEFREVFGSIPKEERAIVCEDCFIKFMEKTGRLQ